MANAILIVDLFFVANAARDSLGKAKPVVSKRGVDLLDGARRRRIGRYRWRKTVAVASLASLTGLACATGALDDVGRPVAAAQQPSAPATEPQSEVEACLHEARVRLRTAETAFIGMRAAMTGPASEDQCRRINERTPFLVFEGRWREMPVEHTWRTVDVGTQLVLIRDGDVYKRGINVRINTNLCGIVMESSGQERRHAGRFVAGGGDYGPHLELRTEDRIYRKRVTCDRGRRRYEIRETILEGHGAEPHLRAVYAPPPGSAADEPNA